MTFFASMMMLATALETSDTTTQMLAEIGRLVENNNKQLEVLEDTGDTIEHQSILSEYNSSGPFQVIISRCNDSEKWDADGNYLGMFYSFKPTVITKDGNESTVPFRIFADLEFRDKENKRDGVARNDFAEIGLPSYVYNIEKSGGDIEVNIQSILDYAKESGFEYVHVDFEYDFQPISPVKDNAGFGQQQDGKPFPMVLFKLHDNGKWHVEDFEEQYPCRS
ncbi:hypothetical protein [Nitrosopumilus adriaticus]|uniref:Uncharacterized protein n=1 Tax=Nitrosopumilus adriaticus TaxID=1580092 RepID=A0A0D5C3X7_9ARCH|nr:hypothetical protein [Nitrosopumilus adriaticus]AJW71050.1 hypothetical protein NADRNF5_1364 [Nitrosopumilus adriaticus]